ncbi:hypothetical protein Mext_2716 [Methylorubrum extorquens PA1]|nr:hypothetical protein Mext_2716 [Methylorubrum extorquens PA1]
MPSHRNPSSGPVFRRITALDRASGIVLRREHLALLGKLHVVAVGGEIAKVAVRSEQTVQVGPGRIGRLRCPGIESVHHGIHPPVEIPSVSRIEAFDPGEKVGNRGAFRLQLRHRHLTRSSRENSARGLPGFRRDASPDLRHRPRVGAA